MEEKYIEAVINHSNGAAQCRSNHEMTGFVPPPRIYIKQRYRRGPPLIDRGAGRRGGTLYFSRTNYSGRFVLREPLSKLSVNEYDP